MTRALTHTHTPMMNCKWWWWWREELSGYERVRDDDKCCCVQLDACTLRPLVSHSSTFFFFLFYLYQPKLIWTHLNLCKFIRLHFCQAQSITALDDFIFVIMNKHDGFDSRLRVSLTGAKGMWDIGRLVFGLYWRILWIYYYIYDAMYLCKMS